jgi:hypothetical protein
MAFDLKQQFETIPVVKVAYNIGCLFDVPTGEILYGKYGEAILNGGLTQFTGFVGIANNFKTAVMDYQMLVPVSHFEEAQADTYDTETNISEERKQYVAEQIEGLSGNNNPIVTGRWRLTDNTLYLGDEWHDNKKKFLWDKKKNASSLMRVTPFLDKDGSLFKIMVPTFSSVDSLTRFETKDVVEMLDSNQLGDSGANTSYMKQGGSKARFINEIPRLAGSTNNVYLMTAHIGKTIAMDPRAAPIKKLQYLKNGDTMKGVTDQFLFLTTACWQCSNATPLINDGTKGPEYPRSSDDDMKMDTDLTIVTLTLLRNKKGRSGLTMQILASQRDGVLPSLSEFHYIKTVDRFGLGGNVQNYYLELLPDVKLSRTVVRGKLDANPRLRRAVNILAEMLQMFMLWKDIESYICTPKELYDGLIALGYDWDVLLDTRGYWCFDNDKQPTKFLVTYDLLRMLKSEYIPYWMENPPQKALEAYNAKNATPWKYVAPTK